MPVSQSVACRCRSRASSSSQAARKRTKRSAGLSRVVCRRHLRSVGLTGEQIGYERHGGRPKRERQLQGHPRRRSSATARGYGKLNCPPYLEIRRGERTTVGFPILSTCNPDISSHQQPSAATAVYHAVSDDTDERKVACWGRSPADRSPAESLDSASGEYLYRS
jgi:hypothetical protein